MSDEHRKGLAGHAGLLLCTKREKGLQAAGHQMARVRLPAAGCMWPDTGMHAAVCMWQVAPG